MNRKSAFRSAFITPRFLFCFSFCVIGLLLAFVAVAISSNGDGLNDAERVTASKQPLRKINGVPIFNAAPSSELDRPAELAPAISLSPNGEIDMGALGIRPLPLALVPSSINVGNNGPDSAAIGANAAYMQSTTDIVDQNTTAAFAALSTGWTLGEFVQIYVNGVLTSTLMSGSFGSGTPLGYLAISINTGSGFGYVTVEGRGLTSGKQAGAVVQVAPTGPYLPGLAGAPHAENTSGTSPAILLFGTGFPASTVVTRYRNGVNLATTTTSSLGSFFVGVTPTNNGNTAAVWSYGVGASPGNMNGTSQEERSDAGGPQAGDQNSARAFVDRAVLDSAAGGNVAFVGEGFSVGETVNISACTTGSVTADGNVPCYSAEGDHFVGGAGEPVIIIEIQQP